MEKKRNNNNSFKCFSQRSQHKRLAYIMAREVLKVETIKKDAIDLLLHDTIAGCRVFFFYFDNNHRSTSWIDTHTYKHVRACHIILLHYINAHMQVVNDFIKSQHNLVNSYNATLYSTEVNFIIIHQSIIPQN